MKELEAAHQSPLRRGRGEILETIGRVPVESHPGASDPRLTWGTICVMGRLIIRRGTGQCGRARLVLLLAPMIGQVLALLGTTAASGSSTTSAQATRIEATPSAPTTCRCRWSRPTTPSSRSYRTTCLTRARKVRFDGAGHRSKRNQRARAAEPARLSC